MSKLFRNVPLEQLKVSVLSDRPDEYVGERVWVKSQIITCQDVDPSGYRLLMSFDYTLSEDEEPKYAGTFAEKTQARKLRAGKSGREISFSGHQFSCLV